MPTLTDLPTVTVIILTKDRPNLLAASSGGVLRGTDYPALDLLVVDNGSTDPAALALLDTLAATPRVRLLRRPGPFNFSALNNAAAQEASGEVLVLLNNDTEMPDPGWLRELVRYAVRPDVGLVGARLLHRNGTLQHGGMALGPAGRAVHMLSGAPRDAPGYEGQFGRPARPVRRHRRLPGDPAQGVDAGWRHGRGPARSPGMTWTFASASVQPGCG